MGECPAGICLGVKVGVGSNPSVAVADAHKSSPGWLPKAPTMLSCFLGKFLQLLGIQTALCSPLETGFDLTNILSPPRIQIPGPPILHVTQICIESGNVLTF